MKPKRVIAFAGPAGVGKSTAAQYLTVEPRLGKVLTLSFAAPMKKMVATILREGSDSFKQEHKNDPLYGLCGKSPRYLLETIGTEWGKNLIGQNIWLDIVANQILSTSFDTYVIDDLRTEAEADYIHKVFGGTVIELSRDGVAYKCDHITSSQIPDRCIDHRVTTVSVSDLWVLRELARPM